MNINIQFYKKAYSDVFFLDNEVIKKHYEKIGKKEERLSNPVDFFKVYKQNHIDEYKKNNKNIRINEFEIMARIWNKNYDEIVNNNNLIEKIILAEEEAELVKKLNIPFYKKAYRDLSNKFDEEITTHWIEIGSKENRLGSPVEFFKKHKQKDIDEFKKNNKNIKTNEYEIMARIWNGNELYEKITVYTPKKITIYEQEKNIDISKNSSVLVLLLTYNRSEKCINVINDMLNQTYNNFKLLVIDDGSIIDEFNKLENYIKTVNNDKIILLRNDNNLKIPKTINRGMKYFLSNNYDYFTWISDDNLYYPNFIELLLDADSDFISSSFDYDDLTNKNKEKIYNNNYKSADDIINNFKGLASFLWSRNAIEKIGYYNEDLYGCEDLDYEIRTFLLIENRKFINDSTMKYILHNDSLFTKESDRINKLAENIKFIYNKLITNENLFIYYSKNSWNKLFQRPHQICRFMDKTFLKIFITCDDIIKYEEEYNLLIIPYNYRNLVINILDYDKYSEKIIYYTDPRLYDEINEFSNKYNILFDLIDAPIDEFTVWKPNLEKSVKSAKWVMYSHPKLVEFLNEIDNTNEYFYISNGCDYDHFSKAKNRIGERPKEFPKTNKPILGYYGAFSEWIDYKLIKKYADEKKYHIVMIGGIKENPSYNIRFKHKNITWLDHKPYEELPYYLSWFDVCLLPFKECELNKYVNPCKLWEYMASEKEIIKSGIDINCDKLITCKKICNKINIFIENNLIEMIFSEKIDDKLKKEIYKYIYECDFEFKDIIINFQDRFIKSILNKFDSDNRYESIISEIIINDKYENIFDLNSKIYNRINLEKNINKKLDIEKPVIILFSMIDYYFRIQRHQHICKNLSDLGYRVFYTKTTFSEEFNENYITDNLIEINLNCSKNKNPYTSKLNNLDIEIIKNSIDKLKKKYNFNYFISIIANPFWYQYLKYEINTTIIYDCADFHKGFGNIDEYILKTEDELLQNSDCLILTSPILQKKMNINRDHFIIRNACEYDYFNEIKILDRNNVIGYYGAISDWFDYKLIEKIAIQFSNYEIHLIGNVWCIDAEYQKNIEKLKRFNNIKFFGEIPYKELYNYLSKFKIGIIPFIKNELIECTNPVKLYEMMGIGIPVVMTNLDDVIEMEKHIINNNLFYISENNDIFIKNIQKAILNNDEEYVKDRKLFAKNNSWKSVSYKFNEIIKKINPLISITVLCYNNSEFTKRCINSIYSNSNYNNFEVIVIDNNSNDDTKEKMKIFQNSKNFIYIKNSENFGFAKGMNIGSLNSNSDYIILLNNDTVCGENWLYPLVKNLIINNNIGIVSPITNNCGSEGKQFIYYDNYIDCLKKASKLQKIKINEKLKTKNVPFFAPGLRKEDYFKVGLLDINFGRGGWEDDDLIYRYEIYNKKYKNYCIYNSFVFHEESLTLGKHHYNISNNKDIYCTKWNCIWIPPKYKFENLYFYYENGNIDIDIINLIKNIEKEYKLTIIKKKDCNSIKISININDLKLEKCIVVEKTNNLIVFYKNNKKIQTTTNDLLEIYKVFFTLYFDL